MALALSYETQRDLMTGMVYTRGTTTVVQRGYSYDALGRPLTRTQSRQGGTRNDSFTHNDRSELTAATLGTDAYAYAYDNIGNRETAQESAESATTYESNLLNQYTAIGEFEPTYDDAGNQTTVKTSTGIWSVAYNAENRPTSFANADSGTLVECTYDYMGRRATKKVTVNGSVTLHQRFLYRGYLQIACCDLTRSNHPCLWLITWDPSQPVATRPLAIRKDGTWYTYGWDLTKNICEVYGQNGYVRTNYSHSPYGEVTANGDVTQPVQWSSEYNDTELVLIYYNYRHYNSVDGRWLGRDKLGDKVFHNLYALVGNAPASLIDVLGLRALTPAEQKLIACIREQMKAQRGTCSENLAGQISQMLKDYTAAIQKSGKIDSPSLKAWSYALSVFCNQIKKKYAQENSKFLCSSFARDVLSATGLKLKSELSASYFLNSGDKDMARAGYKVKFVDEANREPGDIIVGGRDGINGEFEAHIGVYIGNELYISQSPKSQYDQLVGQAPGMKI
ncbi:MAG: NlpC/P60 family protein [Akkermansia muciniphila]|nr:NlpC/P60 family protein [Akkermansia muciniphila]